MKQIDPDHPIWEVDFSLPDIEWQQKDDYVQEGLEMTNLRHELFCPVQEDYLKWLDAWKTQLFQVIKPFRKEETTPPVAVKMWKRYLQTIHFPGGFEKYLNILLDKPGFIMRPHEDNRYVVGILLVNLQDNPTGTYFTSIDYKLPGTKGKGVFFLNHSNTMHGIEQTGPGDRIIAYQHISIGHLKDINKTDG